MTAFWNYFIYFAMVAVLLWAAGACAAWKDRKVVAYSATIAGLVVFFSYILIMWISLDRPPMRTMGETRLWYSFFLPLAGIIVYSRWDYKWLLSFSTILALVFIGINLLRLRKKCDLEVAMWILIVNFVLLQMCWWGINYLPSAQGTSVHTYNMQ